MTTARPMQRGDLVGLEALLPHLGYQATLAQLVAQGLALVIQGHEPRAEERVASSAVPMRT